MYIHIYIYIFTRRKKVKIEGFSSAKARVLSRLGGNGGRGFLTNFKIDGIGTGEIVGNNSRSHGGPHKIEDESLEGPDF